MAWIVKVKDSSGKGMLKQGSYEARTKQQAQVLATDVADLLRRNPNARGLGYCPSGSAASGFYSLRPDGKASIEILEK